MLIFYSSARLIQNKCFEESMKANELLTFGFAVSQIMVSVCFLSLSSKGIQEQDAVACNWFPTFSPQMCF